MEGVTGNAGQPQGALVEGGLSSRAAAVSADHGTLTEGTDFGSGCSRILRAGQAEQGERLLHTRGGRDGTEGVDERGAQCV